MADDWFVVNVADAEWLTTEGGEKRPSGSECTFEPAGAEFEQVGVRIHVLPGRGEPNGCYHSEMPRRRLPRARPGECVLTSSRARGAAA